MRVKYVVALVAVLCPTLAYADPVPEVAPAAPAPTVALASPRATLVKLLPRTHQALVFDRTRMEYLVVKVGDAVQGFKVQALESDQLILAGADGLRFVLPLDDDAPTTTGAAPTIAAAKPATELLDPYGDAPAVKVVSVAEAPTVTPSASATTASTPTASPTPTATPSAASLTTTASATAASPTPTATAPAREAHRVSRKELDAELTDFAQLAKEAQIEIVGTSVRLTAIARGSLFDRLGLRAGDLILDVAGHKVASVDDAAQAYVDLATARTIAVAVRRGERTLTLDYTVDP